MSQIAVIRLAPGQAGFYDELSGIYLTAGSPVSAVPSGTNCSQLRRSLRMGTIILERGTLGGDIPEIKIVEQEGQYFLVPNTEEVNKPIYAKETEHHEEEHVAEEVEQPEENKEEKTDEVIEEKEETAEEKEETAEEKEEPAEDNRDLEFNGELVQEKDKATFNYKVGKDVTAVYYVAEGTEEKVEVKTFNQRSKKREGSVELPVLDKDTVYTFYIAEVEEPALEVTVEAAK